MHFETNTYTVLCKGIEAPVVSLKFFKPIKMVFSKSSAGFQKLLKAFSFVFSPVFVLDHFQSYSIHVNHFFIIPEG